MKAEHSEALPERGEPATIPAVAGGPAPRVRACLVVLGGEQFAIDVRRLREVMVVGKPTAVPGAPSFVSGVANLRGEVLALLDIAAVLGLPACRVGPSSKALVLEPASSQVAILDDARLRGGMAGARRTARHPARRPADRGDPADPGPGGRGMPRMKREEGA